jgi:hypothetical protein
MIFVEIFDVDELEKCIEIAFKDDQKLIDSYHILGNGNLGDCVRDTKIKIVEESYRTAFDWYKVLDDYNDIIGFIVISKIYNLLYSFGLNINSREIYKVRFFDELKKTFGGSFTCGLWKKNQRGLRFLEKMGMTLVMEDEKIKILTLCHYSEV